MGSRFLGRWWVFFFVALCAISAGATAQDVAGGHDHPLVRRFPGSVLIGYAQQAHGAIDFQTTTYTGFDLDTGRRHYVEPPLNLDGRVTRLWYESPGSTTSAQLYEYLARRLTSQGFQVLYDSAQDKGASPGKWVNFLASFAPGKPDALVNNRTARVFSSARPVSLRTGTFQQDNTTVRLVAVDWPKSDADSKARQGAYVAIDIVEARVLHEAPSPVAAAASQPDAMLVKAFSGIGRVVLSGVHFVSGSAQLEDGARQALAGVAAYLKAEPEARLYVVGHTDSSGTLEENLELSRLRAQAVVDVLEHDFAIAPGRLSAHGVGPLAPLADNSTSTGRSRNRRVELVRH